MSDFIEKFSSISLNDIKNVPESDFPELTAEEKALASQAVTYSNRIEDADSISNLNDSLRNKTFIVGNKPSKADLLVFEKVFKVASKWSSVEDVSKHRHIIRWVDLIQNTLVNVPESEKLKVSLDIEVPREIKEKKKAKGAESNEKEDSKKKSSGDKDNAAKGANKLAVSEQDKKEIAEAQKAKKAAKAKAKADAQAKQQAAAVPPNPSMVDFRVGFIEKAEKHPNADSLYVSQINLGEPEGPRTICSGLVKYVPLEQMQQRYIVCIANLKPVTMRGVKSCGMVLCASNENTVEIINPPEGSKAGDKLFFEDFNGTPEKQLNPKKKIWEAVQPHFSTTETYEVIYTEEGKEPKKLVNSNNQPCRGTSIARAHVS